MKLFLAALILSSTAFASSNKRVTLEKRLTNDFENCVIGLAIEPQESRGEVFHKYNKISREKMNINVGIITYTTQNSETRKKFTYEILVHAKGASGWMPLTTWDMIPGFIAMDGVELIGSVRLQKSQDSVELDYSSCF